MIELEFAEAQRVAVKRKRFFRYVLAAGLSAAVGTLLNWFLLGSILTMLFLFLVWLASAVIYTGGRVFPKSIIVDADPRWHINPWRDGLESLVSENRHIWGIILLSSMPLCGVIIRLVRFTSHMQNLGP